MSGKKLDASCCAIMSGFHISSDILKYLGVLLECLRTIIQDSSTV